MKPRPSSQLPAQPRVASSASKPERVAISFEFAKAGESYCLSDCKSDEVKQAVDCFRKMCSMTWVDLIATGGGRNKTGLHCTPYDDSALKHASRPAWISKDARILGVRASGAFRIFGIRRGEAFCVLWFDPHHKICPG